MRYVISVITFGRFGGLECIGLFLTETDTKLKAKENFLRYRLGDSYDEYSKHLDVEGLWSMETEGEEAIDIAPVPDNNKFVVMSDCTGY